MRSRLLIFLLSAGFVGIALGCIIVLQRAWRQDDNSDVTTKGAPDGAATATSVPIAVSVYSDSLAPGWANSSWNATVNLAASGPVSPVYEGTHSIAFTATAAWGALSFSAATPVSATALSSLTFAVRATQVGQSYSVHVVSPTGAPIGKFVTLIDHGGDPATGAFTIYDIPLDSLNLDVAGQEIGGFYIQDMSGGAQPVVFVDAVGFRGLAPATPGQANTLTPPPLALTVYGDSLNPAWADASWGSTVNLANNAPVYTGTKSAALTVTAAWGALYFNTASPLPTTASSSLGFALQASTSGQRYVAALVNSAGVIFGNYVSLAEAGGDPVPGTWKIYNISLGPTGFGVGGQPVKGVVIQDLKGGAQPLVYLGELGFRNVTAAPEPTPRPTPTPASPAPSATPTPSAASLPSSSIALRSAAQLRIDLRQSQSLDAAVSLDLTDTIVLSRLLAIDDALEMITDHYGTDYLWSLAMMMAESNLDPSAQGPLADDRGLAQIGYEVERVGKLWGTDRTSPYYYADLDPRGSVWEPKTNMIYQAIWFRNILGFTYVTSLDQTYAVYTKGINSVDPVTGAISEQAKGDVRRARSHIPRLQKLLFLKDYARQQGAIPAAVSPLARQILEIDRTTTDGIETYTKLRDLFIDAGANGTGGPFAEYTYIHEAISYTDLLDAGYEVDPKAALQQIKAVLDRRGSFMKSDGSVTDAFSKDYTKVTEGLVALSAKRTYVVVPGDSYVRVAERFAVDINDMLRLNNRTVDSPLYPKDVLQMPSYRTYRVKQDDVYFAIARAFGVDSTVLLRINGRTVNSPLLEGEVLEIPPK